MHHHVYRERWLEPIERGSGSPMELCEKLHKFTVEQSTDDKNRHYSKVEKTVAAALKMTLKSKTTAYSVSSYARYIENGTQYRKQSV